MNNIIVSKKNLKGLRTLGRLMGALMLLGTATACQDMFTADNNLVTTDLAPKDTVYQVTGIINRMQKLADRTILLGELRGDLVTVDPAHASVDLQELGANKVSETNAYNQPADYYNVINNCNIYLAYVDSTYKVHGKKFYETEVIGVKTFRAWCYLELAKIYGKVPFVTTPVLDPQAAEQLAASTKDHKDLVEITTWLIDDLKGYAYRTENDRLRPDWGNSSKYSQYFIPVRVMLGELYLWRGSYTQSQTDYIEAVRMYHNYLTFTNEEHVMESSYNNKYMDNSFNNASLSYENWFSGSGSSTNNKYVAVMPLDTAEYVGTVSEIRSIFCSAYKNDYYPAAVASERLDSISMKQIYSRVDKEGGEAKIYYPVYTKSTNKRMIGDLRLMSVINEETVNNKYNNALSRTRTFISKYTNGANRLSTDERLSQIPYYRLSTIYLHMAEALNRAGYPQTAFLVLNWGITEETLASQVYKKELYELEKIKTLGFNTPVSTPYYSQVLDSVSADFGSSSFLAWPIGNSGNLFVTQDKLSGADRDNGTYQCGIHSLGCGDTEYNPYYTLPADDSRWTNVTNPTEPIWNKKEDPDTVIYKAAMELYKDSLSTYNTTMAKNLEYLYEDSHAIRTEYVAQRILDEEALELCFEGTRFYDLLRYTRQNGDQSNTVKLPDYIKWTYGMCSEIDNKYNGTSWYIPLPKR